jgi:hypothetical protein
MPVLAVPDNTPSPPVQRLALAGLIPFVLGTALVWLVHEQALGYVALGLSAYAALVIAFIGGIPWGVGFAQAGAPAPAFVAGMAPLLLAWVAVMMPPHAGLVLEGVLLVAGYLVDRKLYPRLGLSRWLTLRFRLSAVAALCCFLAAAGT